MTEASESLETELQAVADRFETTKAEVTAIEGEPREAVPEQLTAFVSLLDSYEERATGSGDFGGYVEFRAKVDQFVASLPAELPAREAFEEAQDALDRRRLRERDFEAAREALAPAREVVETIENHEEAAEGLRRIRSRASERVRTLEARLDDLDEKLSYADLDLDQPVDALRKPIETYNREVTDAFEQYRTQATSRELLALFGEIERYPLVEAPSPPEGLRTSLESAAFGTMSVPELLEHAGFSRSKLDHLVEDPAGLQETVSEYRLYLERLDAGPFRIDWPPPPAATLRWRIRELISVVDRFAGESTIAPLRTLGTLTRSPERFDRLRTIALARADLSEADREALATGRLAEERDRIEGIRNRLVSTLETVPHPEH